jgi:hypothetical protein
MNPRKRRGPVLGNRPSHDSTTTTALDGPSLSLSDADKTVPRRYSRGYFLHLDLLSLPDDLKFWALAPVERRPPKYVESVWALDEQRRFRQLVIDIRTGEECAASRFAA